MLFTDYRFIFVFLPLVLVLFWIRGGRRYRWLLLLVASYIFYGAWNYKFVPLLLFSTCVDYAAGLAIGRTSRSEVKKTALSLSIFCNLGILGVFKYYDFCAHNVGAVLGCLGFNVDVQLLQLVLPVGISFYTFQSMSYTIDVYHGVVDPARDFRKFAAYVSLFSQLVAGPIVRYRDMGDQFDRLGQRFRIHYLVVGLQIFLLGLFKKVLIADYLAGMINPMFDSYGRLGMLGAWMAVMGYTFQIYFDFSGYSDMAIGLGKMFGLDLPVNFNSPYKSVDIADFWKRWHISLSTWLRDYLYIPLGGGRCSRKRIALNVFIVFLLGGLWHGASWTFIIWGIYYGVLVVFCNIFRRRLEVFPLFARKACTFVLVMMGWVFFRSESVGMAAGLFKKMFAFRFESAVSPDLIKLCLINGALLYVVSCLPNTNSHKGSTRLSVALLYAFLFMLTIVSLNSIRIEFLYYQF